MSSNYEPYYFEVEVDEGGFISQTPGQFIESYSYSDDTAIRSDARAWVDSYKSECDQAHKARKARIAEDAEKAKVKLAQYNAIMEAKKREETALHLRWARIFSDFASVYPEQAPSLEGLSFDAQIELVRAHLALDVKKKESDLLQEKIKAIGQHHRVQDKRRLRRFNVQGASQGTKNVVRKLEPETKPIEKPQEPRKPAIQEQPLVTNSMVSQDSILGDKAPEPEANDAMTMDTMDSTESWENANPVIEASKVAVMNPIEEEPEQDNEAFAIALLSVQQGKIEKSVITPLEKPKERKNPKERKTRKNKGKNEEGKNFQPVSAVPLDPSMVTETKHASRLKPNQLNMVFTWTSESGAIHGGEKPKPPQEKEMLCKKHKECKYGDRCRYVHYVADLYENHCKVDENGNKVLNPRWICKHSNTCVANKGDGVFENINRKCLYWHCVDGVMETLQSPIVCQSRWLSSVSPIKAISKEGIIRTGIIRPSTSINRTHQSPYVFCFCHSCRHSCSSMGR